MNSVYPFYFYFTDEIYLGHIIGNHIAIIIEVATFEGFLLHLETLFLKGMLIIHMNEFYNL